MSDSPRRYTWEDYLYPAVPGQQEVLRNHLGLTDPQQAFVAERVLVHGRVQELLNDPGLVPHTFDAAHWKAIHKHLFQDMYAWAGEFRTVNMVNPANGDRTFLNEALVEDSAESFLAHVRDAGLFADRDRAGVVQGLAATLQGLNMIHPFREGNGRSQRALTDHIAAQAGWLVDWERMGAGVQNEVMAQSFAGELAPLREALAQVVVPMIRGAAVDESPWPAPPVVQERAPDFWRFSRPLSQVLRESPTPAHPADYGTPSRGVGHNPEPGLER